MDDEDLDLDEREVETGFVNVEDGPAGMTFIARDVDGRCVETCHLDLEGDHEDVAASAQELVDFLRKFGKNSNFMANQT